MPVNDRLASDQWYRFRWCVERGHYAFIDKAHRCDQFFAGDQWEQADLDKLKLQGRPALTINKILSTMSTVMGEQIYNRNEVLFRPAANGRTEIAEALTKVWMQIAQSNQLQWVRSDVFCDGIIRSRGFYDVRLDFDDNMRGQVKISLLNGKNVILDPDAEEYDPDEWNDIFISKWVTWQDIAMLYNEDDAKYLKDRESSMFPYAYDSIERVRDRFAGPALQGAYYGISDTAGVRRNIRTLERQYHVWTSQNHFVDVISGETRPIPDAWDRNKISDVLSKAGGQLSTLKKQVKRVRWTVTADHVVLHDDWSPYKHFTPVPYFPYFRHGRTIGLVENLIGSQELLNKTSSQELHIINTTANSGWKVKQGALRNMTVEELRVQGAQTGLVLELDDVNSAEKIQPNQTPTGLDRVSFKAEEHIKTISGVSDSMQGFDREDVAAKAIAYKQQRGSGNLAKPMDNLERTDWLLARNVLDIIQAYYTEERLIMITHDDVTREPETITVNQMTPEGEVLNDLTLGEYSIVVTSTPARATMEDSQFEQAKGLREMGVQIPDSVLIENSRLQRRAEIVKQMQAAAETPEAQQRRELEMRLLGAQVAKVEGEAAEKGSKTALDQARTQREMVAAQNEAQGDGGMQAELAKLQQQHEFKMQELALKEREMEREFALKLREKEQELQLREREFQLDAQIKARQAAAQEEATRQQGLAARLGTMNDNDGDEKGTPT